MSKSPPGHCLMPHSIWQIFPWDAVWSRSCSWREALPFGHSSQYIFPYKKTTLTPKACSRENFLPYFQTKARPRGWHSCWYQGGAACRFLRYAEVAEVVLQPRDMHSTARTCCPQLLNVQCSPSQQRYLPPLDSHTLSQGYFISYR